MSAGQGSAPETDQASPRPRHPFYEGFGRRLAVADMVTSLEQGNQTVNESFNASLLEYVAEAAPAMRIRMRQPSHPNYAAHARALLSARYRELRLLASAEERQVRRRLDLQRYGRTVIRHINILAEPTIVNDIAAGYKDDGQMAVVQAMGDTFTALGMAIEGVAPRGTRTPEPIN